MNKIYDPLFTLHTSKTFIRNKTLQNIFKELTRKIILVPNYLTFMQSFDISIQTQI